MNMNKGQRVIACLLTAIVVMMGLNLAFKAEARADAHSGDQFAGGTEPRVVGGAVTSYVYNGTSTGAVSIARFWDDGKVDATLVHGAFDDNCAIEKMCAPQTLIAADDLCPADINTDSDVNFPDLLEVLTEWGPCK